MPADGEHSGKGPPLCWLSGHFLALSRNVRISHSVSVAPWAGWRRLPNLSLNPINGVFLGAVFRVPFGCSGVYRIIFLPFINLRLAIRQQYPVWRRSPWLRDNSGTMLLVENKGGVVAERMRSATTPPLFSTNSIVPELSLSQGDRRHTGYCWRIANLRLIKGKKIIR